MATADDIIQSVRAQIPDPQTDSDADGTAFSAAQLRLWINDAMRHMAQSAPIVKDWHAVQSQQGMDIYVLPQTIQTVEQLWYDNWPCMRSPEFDALFVSKVTTRSYFFGPHAIHATPRLHVWPCSDRTGATTTLNGAINASVTSITLTDASAFKVYGFFQIDNEIVLYRTVTGNVVTNVLRGQAGTTAVTHSNGAPVTELNIFFKCSRVPVAIATKTDPIEIPQGLWPLIELYVISKVREAEQDHQTAAQMRQEYQKAIDLLAARANVPGIRQGTQVRTELAGTVLWGGRVYVP